jgi:hypothetical protein
VSSTAANDWLKRINVESDDEGVEWHEGSFFANLLLVTSELIEYSVDTVHHAYDDTTANADHANDVDDAETFDNDTVSVADSVPEPTTKRKRRRKRTIGYINKGKKQGTTSIYKRVPTPDRKRKKKVARITPVVDEANQRHN